MEANVRWTTCRWCGAERQRAGKNKAEAADP